jgi:hypothetical protein
MRYNYIDLAIAVFGATGHVFDLISMAQLNKVLAKGRCLESVFGFVTPFDLTQP